jgi:uncharacterized membrane protein YoaK (UPF0700 family)
VYAPAGDTVAVAVPLHAEQEAGVELVLTVNAVVVGQVAQVVVRKYTPAIHRLKQSPLVLQLKLAVVAAAATVVFTCSKFHQFQAIGSAVPLRVREFTAIWISPSPQKARAFVVAPQTAGEMGRL